MGSNEKIYFRFDMCGYFFVQSSSHLPHSILPCIKFIIMREAHYDHRPNFSNTHRRIQKKAMTSFTQFVFEEDLVAQNLAHKGHSYRDPLSSVLSSAHHHTLQQKRRRLLFEKDRSKTGANWTTRTCSAPQAPRNNQQAKEGSMRQSNSKSIKIIKRSISECRGDEKFSSSEANCRAKQTEKMQTEQCTQMIFDEQGLNNELACDFKGILAKFNKAKQEIQEKGIKIEYKRENSKYKHLYKKPNFYQYHKFYRQNYQAKQLQETVVLFQKVEVKTNLETATTNSKRIITNKSLKQPLSTRYTPHGQRKVSKLLMTRAIKTIEDERESIENSGSLLASRRECLRVSHNDRITKTNSMKRTDNRRKISIQCEKIEPWRSLDHFEGFDSFKQE